jgi:hypothetical protein
MAHDKNNCNVGSYGNLNWDINIVGKPHGNKPCGKQDVNERIILQQDSGKQNVQMCTGATLLETGSSGETLWWQWHLVT